MFAVFFFVCLLGEANANADIVPAILIDTDNVLQDVKWESNPFTKTSLGNFTTILKKAAQKSVTVILFIEKSFSVEDVCMKDEAGSPFYYIQQSFADKKVKYFCAVDSPYQVIQSLFEPLPLNVFHLRTPSTKLQLFDGKTKYFYAFFEDMGNETRVEALRRHDKIIKEVCFVVRQIAAGPVVAIYTGKKNPMNLVKEPIKYYQSFKPKPDVLSFSTNTTLFKLSGVRLLTNGLRWSQDGPLSVNEDFSDRHIRSRLEFAGFLLEFYFKLTPKDWALDKITIWEEDEPVGTLRTNIRAPWGFSYACHENLDLVNSRDGSVITISHYQIEPIEEWVKGAGSMLRSEPRYFRASINCGPFFSAPIMTCIFVVGMLLMILFYGIMSMMDLRTNSRYDDPSGKLLNYCGDGGMG